MLNSYGNKSKMYSLRACGSPFTDRVVYSHLLRHSRLEGKLQLRFSIPWLSRSIGLCSNSTRWAVRRLVSRGLVRLVQCSKADT
jgi:hypothetical protein